MKKLLLSIPILFIWCCDKKKDSEGIPWEPSETEKVENYTSEDADLALEAFNQQYFNEEAKLYYSTTEKNDLGSIWTQAIMWDIVMDAYHRTEDEKYLILIEDIYEGGHNEYDAYNWENTVEWFIYDDIMWWVVSLARAYEITDKEIYLEESISGFERVWRGSYDEDSGGMYWDFEHSGKNACINYPTVIAAMQLYNITGEEHYKEKAIEIYEWSRNNLFEKSTGRVADHKVGNQPPGYEDYTYNQGTLIGAAMLLYESDGDEVYLEDAIKAADYTKNEMSNEDGILPAEGDWNEQGVLKAIFARYLMYLVDIGGQEQYESCLKR